MDSNGSKAEAWKDARAGLRDRIEPDGVVGGSRQTLPDPTISKASPSDPRPASPLDGRGGQSEGVAVFAHFTSVLKKGPRASNPNAWVVDGAREEEIGREYHAEVVVMPGVNEVVYNRVCGTPVADAEYRLKLTW